MAIVISPQSALQSSGGGGGSNSAIFSQITKAKISEAWTQDTVPTVIETIGTIDIHGYFDVVESPDLVTGPLCVLSRNTSYNPAFIGEIRTAIFAGAPKVGTVLGEVLFKNWISYSTTTTSDKVKVRIRVGKLSKTGVFTEMGFADIENNGDSNNNTRSSVRIPKTNTVTITEGDMICVRFEVISFTENGTGSGYVYVSSNDTDYFLFSFN